MRILILNNFARVTGGADRHCLELAAGLRGRGHSVALLATASDDNIESRGYFVESRLTREGWAQTPLWARPAAGLSALWNRASARAARAALRTLAPDVVHAHRLYPQLSVSPLVTLRRAGVPVVQTLHDYELMSASVIDHTGGAFDRSEDRPAYLLRSGATWPVRRFVHRRMVSEWIAVSEFVAERYRNRGIDARVLVNFTLLPETEPAPFEKRDGVVHAGWIGEEKGLMEVVEIARRCPTLKFTLVGDGRGSALAAAAAAELRNVDFKGRLSSDDVGAILGRARACLMPARWEEPAGLVALEAMARGTPVVATPRGGLAAYVSNAGGGVLAQRVPELAQACERLCTDRAAWQEASLNGRAATATTHSLDRHLDGIEAIYAAAGARDSTTSTRSRSNSSIV